MKLKKNGLKIISLILALCMIITLLPMDKVFATSFYNRINVQSSKNGVYEVAQAQFDAKEQTVELVYNQPIMTGDILIYENGDESTYGKEGYGITVSENNTATITASSSQGALYGLQNLLQQLEKGDPQSVDITQPYKPVRSLFVDTARKYFSVSWFESMIREMAWNGLNTLYISFSNDEAFRFLLDDMSLSFDNGSGQTITYSDEFMSHLADNPERVSDSQFLTERNANCTDEGNSRVVTNYDNNKYHTQDDMERILAYAKAYGINVIPELNSPGHFGQVMWYFPEYRIQGTWYEDGQPHYGLNLNNKEAFNFGQALVKKYINFFAEQGITSFCVGGDEYAAGGASNELIAYYTNALAEYAESKKMTVYAWNDGQAAHNNLLKDSVIVNAWNGTSNNYSLINFDSNQLYYVLKNYQWKPNARSLFETWQPNVYNNTQLSNILGACVAIWCDVPNKETQEIVLKNMTPIVQAFGYKMWNYSEVSTLSLTDDYANYDEFKAAVTNAPNVSEETVLKSVGYDTSSLPSVDVEELPNPSVGDGYELVTFNSPTVSTNVGWHNNSGNLIDGNTSTVAWTNAQQDENDYMQVDLGSVQFIDTVTVTSPAHNDVCENALVQVSKDGNNWDDIGNHTGDSSRSVEDTYNVNSDIRYIRVLLTQYKAAWWQLSEISWSPRSATTNVIEDGTYIIVNDTNKALSSVEARHNDIVGLSKNQVTIESNIANPTNEIYEWTFTRLDNGKYYIQDSNSQYLNIGQRDNLIVSTSPQEINVEVINGKVVLHNGTTSVNYYIGNGQLFSSYYIERDTNDLHNLYKKIISGLNTNNLYSAIVTANSYNNDNGQYGSVEYDELQVAIRAAAALYQEASQEGTTVTQAQVDAQTEALLHAIQVLELSDTSSNYIEIPVEILDFKADGVMFEYEQNGDPKGLYELLSDTKFSSQLTYGGQTVPMPGTLGHRYSHDEWNGWDQNCKRTGLVEEYLVNGAPVYKQETVDYVAKLIAKDIYTLLDDITNGNTNIIDKIRELSGGYDSTTETNTNLGSWEDTLSKTSTGSNGGNMTWNSIQTCYDLAYYVLNNMWRSTQAIDRNDDIYNYVVPERTFIRMLLGEDDKYHLDSTKKINYIGEYIYNSDLETPNNEETKFTPINNLGYESSDECGDTTDKTSGTNYHFTMHAYGSFVYNADDNLYFYFDGDDDVYYYINGKLAMDIGGAHSHCDDILYLNDIADEFGLVDGGVYSFDMFYAERHTTQANLEFETNIKIMDTKTLTTKGQYDTTTGEVIPYGAVVDAGKSVTYSFDLLNMRSINVSNILFSDETLGSYLSKDLITLYDPNKTNGATTDISDIVVYYRTYDRPTLAEEGVINDDIPVMKSVSQITEMIETANENNYSSLEKGSYVVNISNENELKSLLELGIPTDTQISIYGIKRNVTANDRPYINTVDSRAYYVSNGKLVAINGIATQKLTVLNSIISLDKLQVVVDFGKDINISKADIDSKFKLNNNVTATFYGIVNNGRHNQMRRNVNNVFTENNKLYNSLSGVGNYYIEGNNIRFELNRMLEDVEKLYAVYKIVDTSLADSDYKEYYILVEIDIVPATIVYYETEMFPNLLTFPEAPTGYNNDWDIMALDNDPENESDSIQNDGTVGRNQTYGYDTTYLDDKYLSDGESFYAEGVSRSVTITTFSFTGTGFDLISRTGNLQGSIRVDIYRDAEMKNRVKAITVINKSESNLELYQIPVVSVNDLEHGTYYVKIGVNGSYDSDGNGTIDANNPLDRGNEFYFDAIRVFDPIDVYEYTESANIARSVYSIDNELMPEIIEVRKILLDSTTYSSGVTGALFIDRTQKNVDLGTYKTIGPNNEVYLQKGNSIAFKVKANGIIGGIDIGAKSADGKPAKLQVMISNAKENATVSTTLEAEVTHSTALFYDLLRDASNKNINEYLDENGEAYIVVSNIADNSILSITDIKVGYIDAPVNPEPLMLLADDSVLMFARRVFVEPDYDIHSATVGAKSYRLLQPVVVNVVTTTDVEKIVVRDVLGIPLLSDASYTINSDGMKVWKVKYLTVLLGNQKFKITGYGSEGQSGASVTISTKIKLF